MTRSLHISAIWLILLICGCSTVPKSVTKLPGSANRQRAALTAAEEEDSIREAVYRYKIDQYLRYPNGDRVFFLTIYKEDGRTSVDPSDTFMTRFSDYGNAVRKGSRSKYKESEGIVDRDTEESGTIFNTGRILKISETEALVRGGYYKANLSSSGNTYTVEKKNGKWTVTHDEMHWISDAKPPFQPVNALEAQMDALQKLQKEPAAELDALLPLLLDKAFKGEL